MGLEFFENKSELWTEYYRKDIISFIENGFTTEILRHYGVSDFVANGDKVLLKFYKRMNPLSDEELKANYGR